MKKTRFYFIHLAFWTIFFTFIVFSPRDGSPSVRAIAQTPQADDANALVKSAFELYRQKKYDDALANCVKAQELNANDFRPHYIAGLVYSAQWKMKSASEEFAKAVALVTDDKDLRKKLYLMKARADRYRNAWEESSEAARNALKIDPSYAEAYAALGEVLRYNDKTRDEALAAYRSALKFKPDMLSLYEELGTLLQQLKDEKGAEEMFRQGMTKDPAKMAGRFALGRMLVKQGRLREAREIWNGRTNDKDDTFPNFITELERAERLENAKSALAQKPDDPETLLEIGYAVMDGASSWVVDGRQERALEYFQKALKLRPGFAAAQFAICKAYVQIADTDKEKNKNVEEELAKLRKLDPKLAKEIEEYRKTYSGAIKASGATLNQ